MRRHPRRLKARRKAFICKWRLKHRAVADSLEEAGNRLFTFTRLPPSQWRSARTTNAIERLHEEFKRRIKTQTVLPSADTAAMLFWALLASGQINMRKVDGWQTLAANLIGQPIDLAARSLSERCRVILRCAHGVASKDVAAELGLHEHTVGKWRRRFLKDRCRGSA